MLLIGLPMTIGLTLWSALGCFLVIGELSSLSQPPDIAPIPKCISHSKDS